MIAATFAEQFASAHTRISGEFNLASLLSLREALPEFSREEFDAELRILRIARKYSLSACENRTDITREQRDAGIQQGNETLLYCVGQ